MNLTQLLKDIAAVVGRHLTAYSETPVIAQAPAVPETLTRLPVDSSALRSVGYDATSGTLEIEFQSLRTYRYFDVPRSVYAELMCAGSHIGASVTPTPIAR